MEESVNNSVYVKNRFPVFPQDVETNVSFQIDIRMINLAKRKQTNKHLLQVEDETIRKCKRKDDLSYLGFAFDFWSFVWIHRRHLEREDKCTVTVQTHKKREKQMSSCFQV